MQVDNQTLNLIASAHYYPTLNELKFMANELLVLRNSPMVVTGRPIKDFTVLNHF